MNSNLVVSLVFLGGEGVVLSRRVVWFLAHLQFSSNQTSPAFDLLQIPSGNPKEREPRPTTAIKSGQPAPCSAQNARHGSNRRMRHADFAMRALANNWGPKSKMFSGFKSPHRWGDRRRPKNSWRRFEGREGEVGVRPERAP